MLTYRLRAPTHVAALLVSLICPFLIVPGTCAADPLQESRGRVEAALANIINLDRPGEDGLATIWDGNKYVQCRRIAERSLRCEAAGTLMQPSLAHVLVPARLARLTDLGWQLDPSFGNYVQDFSTDLPLAKIAEKVQQVLVEAYDAEIADLTVRTDWIASQPCPPRNGPTQNLAGVINDSREMASTAIHGCAYKAAAPDPAKVRSAADLIETYGRRVKSEIQRLRINADTWVFVVLDTGDGYVQCAPDKAPPGIYCEAQSVDSSPTLSRILTPERVARLHAAGFADPGRAPNYWKTYPFDKFDDATIAGELLTILYDVYGYDGVPKLAIGTEKGGK